MKPDKGKQQAWYEDPQVEPTLRKEALDLHLAGFNMAEIVSRLEVPAKVIRQWLKEHEVSTRSSLTLRGTDQLRLRLQEVFPYYRLEEEYHIGDRLRLDFYLPELKLAFEVDGPQHYRQINFFHKDEEAFIEAQARDRRKGELCAQQGIHLVRLPTGCIPHRDMLIAWAEEAAKSTDMPQTTLSSWRDIYHQKRMERKQQYQEARREKMRQLRLKRREERRQREKGKE